MLITFYTYTAITIAILWYVALDRHSGYGLWRKVIPSLCIGALWPVLVLSLLFVDVGEVVVKRD